MKIVKHFILGTIAVSAGSSFWSCQDSDKVEAEAPLFTYELTADAETDYESDNNASKKTLALTESAGKLLSNFKSGEKIIGFNLSSDSKATRTAASYSQLSTESEGTSSKFRGSVTGTRAPKVSDEFAFFYPGAAVEGSNKSVAPVSRVQKTYGAKKYTLYQHAKEIKSIVELNLSLQDGTLPTISQKFDYQWAKATPQSVDGSNVTIEVGKLQRKIAIWGLRFTDSKNNPITNIDSINISEVKGSEHLNLANGNFVSDNQIDEIWGISVLPQGRTKFTSAGGKFTYVALLPGTYTDVIVTVYSGQKVYQREYPKLTFNADHFYKTDILKMGEYSPKPYVEVAGIKWATGNFIRYNQGGQEYWGIAPRQWWISQRAIDKNGGVISSQQEQPRREEKVHSDDKDLFRFGDIEHADKVYKVGAYKQGNLDIRQKFYDRPIITREVNRDQAKYGDIVWYYTMNYKDQYRYPSLDELTTLFKNASVIPGYCYTERGNKIYGGYFYNTPRGQERVQAFPTGSKEVEKFKDVSNLVRANKGLFLPITGFVGAAATHYNYRVLTDLNASGKYMSSKSLAAGSDGWEFTTIKYEQYNVPSGQARAIRGVWVGTNQNPRATNPTHPDFRFLR